MSFDPSTLYFSNNIKDNLIRKETIDNLNEQIKLSSSFNYIISLLKTYWYVIFFIVVIIILKILYQRKQRENFEQEKEEMEPFARPTFNPYHSIEENINYNHDLGTDPIFNGVYNNDVQPIDYKPMEFLGAFDEMSMDFAHTRPIINTEPSYYLPQHISDPMNNQYKRVNEENINDTVKITFRKNKMM